MNERLLLELARRLLSVVIYVTALFSLILATMPYTHVPGRMVDHLGQIHPMLAILGAGFGFFFVLTVLANPRNLIERPIELIDRVLKRLFQSIGSRILQG